jgi:hypothetical protein
VTTVKLAVASVRLEEAESVLARERSGGATQCRWRRMRRGVGALLRGRGGAGRLAKLVVVSMRHREAKDEVATKGSGRWCLAPVEASEEEGGRAGERRLSCGMLRGWRCPFIGVGRGAQVAWRGG